MYFLGGPDFPAFSSPLCIFPLTHGEYLVIIHPSKQQGQAAHDHRIQSYISDAAGRDLSSSATRDPTMTYVVYSEDGYIIASGLTDLQDAEIVARAIANSRLESVWLGRDDDADNTLDTEYEPDWNRPMVAARIRIRDWNYLSASPDVVSALFRVLCERDPRPDENQVSIIRAASLFMSRDQAEKVLVLLPDNDPAITL